MRTLGFILFLLICEISDLKSQTFSSVEIGVALSSLSIQDKSYSSRWDPSSAKSIQVQTPFYVGILGVNVDLFDYNAKDDSSPSFKSKNFSTFLGVKLLKIERLYLHSIFRTGVQITSSNEVEFNPTESELFYAFALQPSYKINNVTIFGDAQFRKIFNYYRQNIILVGVGMRVKINVPNKLQEVIR